MTNSNCFVEQSTECTGKEAEKRKIITMEDVLADEALYALRQAEKAESSDNAGTCNENNCGTEEVVNSEYVIHFMPRSGFPIAVDD